MPAPGATELRRSALRVVGVAMLVATGVAVVAQGAGRSPVVVPVEREPQHRPVYENPVLAVLDVRFPPGYVSQFHVHSNDNVSVRLETALARIDTLETTGVPQTAAIGRVVFNAATPPYTHRVANVGDALIRILDVEILTRQPTPTSAVADETTGHEVVVENGRVRLSRIVVAPGARLAAHTHPRGRLEVVVRGSTPGQFLWHEPGAPTRAVVAGPGGAEVVEIEVK